MKADVRTYLRETLGLDDAEMPEFIDTFMETFKECVDALGVEGVNSDFMEVRRVTHMLIGLSQNVGAMDLYREAFALNASAKALDPAACADGIGRVAALYDAYLAE